MLVELVVGDLLVVIGIVAFPDDRDLIAALLQMPVDAVVGDVESAPSSNHLIETLPLKEVFLTLVKGLNQSMRLPCLPQNLSGFFDAVGVPFQIGFVVDQRALLPRRLDLMDMNTSDIFFLPRRQPPA